LWNLKTRREQFVYDGFQGPVNAVFITRNRRQGLASDGRKLALLDLTNGKTLQSMPLSYTSLPTAISPDGKHIAVVDGRRVRHWDIQSGREFPPLVQRSIGSRGCVFSPRGRFLLTGVYGMVNLWDVGESRLRYEFDLCQNVLPADVLACAPDGLHFAAIPSAAGQTLQVFRLPAEVADQPE
jgi:WD40 repeat protein